MRAGAAMCVSGLHRHPCVDIIRGSPSLRAVIASDMIGLAALVVGDPSAVPPSQLVGCSSPSRPAGGRVWYLRTCTSPLSNTPLARTASMTLGLVLGLAALVATSGRQKFCLKMPRHGCCLSELRLCPLLSQQLTFTISSPIAGASRLAVFGSIELPTMFLAGVFVCGQTLTFAQLTACTLIITAIVTTRNRATRNATT